MFFSSLLFSTSVTTATSPPSSGSKPLDQEQKGENGKENEINTGGKNINPLYEKLVSMKYFRE